MGERWPVIICGGGPIGLTLALELEAWRVPVLLLERHRDLSPFPKGRALSIRTMEIYRQLGLEAEITSVGLARGRTMHFLYGETLDAEDHTRVSASTRSRPGSSEPTGRTARSGNRPGSASMTARRSPST